MAYARAQLTPYKRPTAIVILDALPANSAGKILKQKLTEAARERLNPGGGDTWSADTQPPR
jgi:acyl-CoA synthetase (AMP-forming)/AMP-acid ligase II